MKHLIRALFIILLLTVLFAGGLIIFLKKGLTGPVRQFVLPEISKQSGLELELEQVSVDLPGGSARIKGLQALNPPGFTEDHLLHIGSADAMLNLRSLKTRNPIELRKLTLENVNLEIIRNRDGKLNIEPLLAQKTGVPAGTPVPQPEPPAEPAPQTETQPGTMTESAQEIPPLLLSRFESGITVHLRDRKLEQLPDARLQLNIKARNLSTAGAGAPPADFSIDGDLRIAEEIMPLKLTGTLEPLDPAAQPTFDLHGEVLGIPEKTIGLLLEKTGLRAGSASLKMNLKAENGLFRDSDIRFELRNVTIPGEVTGIRELGDLSADKLSCTFPVRGSLNRPEIPWQKGWSEVIRKNIKAFSGGAAANLLEHALKPEEAEAVSAAAEKLFGIKIRPTVKPAETNTVEQTEPAEHPAEAVPEDKRSDREKIVGGLLEVFKESEKENGDPVGKGIEEAFKIFTK